MNNNISKPPIPKCEPVKSYAPNSIERTELQAEYKKAMNKVVEIPMWINGKHIKSKKKKGEIIDIGNLSDIRKFLLYKGTKIQGSNEAKQDSLSNKIFEHTQFMFMFCFKLYKLVFQNF